MKVTRIVSFFRNSTFPLTGLVLGILISSCGEELPEPIFTSSAIEGKIQLGYPSNDIPENILVTALGPYGNKTALTNSNGNFQVSGLGNGTYRLEISKEGYGTTYRYGIQLFGNDTVSVRDELYKLPKGTLPALLSVETQLTRFTWLARNSIAITTNKSTTSGDVSCRVFMSEYQDVSYKNYQWTNRVGSLHRSGFDELLLTVHEIPFESGKKIYLRIYMCNPDEYGYLNTYSGLWTFSTLDADHHSEVMDFNMP
jgi:hypothetical protein